MSKSRRVSAISLAMRSTMVASMPKPIGSANDSPESFSTTRRNRLPAMTSQSSPTLMRTKRRTVASPPSPATSLAIVVFGSFTKPCSSRQ